MKAIKTKITLGILAFVLTFALIAFVKYDVKSAIADQEKVIQNSATFGNDNFNWIKVDTFINKVTQAYHPNAKTEIAKGLLIVQLTGANAQTQDFFNGNSDLLKYKLNDFDFEIDFDKNNNSVIGRFKIKNGLVAIPNDVLITIINKTTK